MARRHRIVIVGASLAGLTTAEALRAEGYDGEILLLGDEGNLPYGRPPLSKQVLLGDWDPEQAIFKSRQDLDDLRIQFRDLQPATGLDIGGRAVHTATEALDFDELVIATGTRSRSSWVEAGVQTLRTLDDAVSIRRAMRGPQRVAVLGAGILGSEIAAAGRTLGASVALIGRSSTITFGAVGGALSARLEELHEKHDVQLYLGRAVHGIAATADEFRVTFAGGGDHTADVVVAAIGGVPNVEWLEDSGLVLDDGVVCDARGAAAPGVYAVGDVAAWSDPVTGVARRVEHQSNAIEQAMAVAGTIVHDRTSPAPVPFFWSEIHGARIKAYGRFPAQHPLIVSDDSIADRPVLLSSDGDGRITGVVAWDAPPPAFRAARHLVDKAKEMQ